MGTIEDMRFVERPQFFNGQLLLASDLQGLESLNREMRWLHNRSLHQPGVGSGFGVSGKRGEREVTIFPGYAIDTLGREIVLTKDMTLAIPPVSGEMDGRSTLFELAVYYPEDDVLEEVETREGTCSVNGVVRLREEPLFCWVRLWRDAGGNLVPKSQQLLKDLKGAKKIVLARIEVKDCRLEQDVIILQRRNARPVERPYLDCGRIPVSEKAKFKPNDKGFIDLEIHVDTRDSGFRTIPFYSAHFEGPRIFSDPADVLLKDNSTILKSGVAGFTLYSRVYPSDIGKRSVGRELIEGIQKRAKELIATSWQIVWMGIEN